MLIVITRTVGGHKEGAMIDLPDSQAEHLIAHGYATIKPNHETNPDPKPRTRRKAATNDGAKVKAGTSETVGTASPPRVLP